MCEEEKEEKLIYAAAIRYGYLPVCKTIHLRVKLAF
jgi:hypothetical protein